jgi:hypothetical protein
MVCVKCKVDKKEKSFTRCRKKVNGLMSYCKECVNDYKKAKAIENKKYKELYGF